MSTFQRPQNNMRIEAVKLFRHMDTLTGYRERLQNLQSAWDNLTLLGQLSGVGNELQSTRHAFTQLTTNLLNQLGQENLKKTVARMRAQAQVSINILVRNLFERTADIGFLATDEDIRRYLQSANSFPHTHLADKNAEARQILRQRFAAYVAKYSVYADIVLVDTKGRVLARLDESISLEQSNAPFIEEALTTSALYVESYSVHDVLPGRHSLIYAYRVCDAENRHLGVLCLCFRLENEMQGIFSRLATPDDWAVITLMRQDGKIIASSDAVHVPPGTDLQPVLDADYRIVRFAGNEYLAATLRPQEYQGYRGPGWYGHIMIPVQHAFDQEATDEEQIATPDIVIRNSALFSEETRAIPSQAQAVQQDLKRSVWNSNVRLCNDAQSENQTFSKTLLREIGNTGAKTQEVFQHSITNLNETAVSTLLQHSRFLASLALDIMDRNLYERANDCRWWALTTLFREQLNKDHLTDQDIAQLTATLTYINDLYTVYSNLIIFDRQGRLLACSRPNSELEHGMVIQEAWVQQSMHDGDPQRYTVSEFSPTPLYGGQPTYIYAAAICAPDSETVIGGIGIVFDAAQQFRAMLHDVVAQNEQEDETSETFAVFLDHHGQVIACSNGHFQPGEKFMLEAQFQQLKNGTAHSAIIQDNRRYHIVGGAMSAGYREYKHHTDHYQNNVLALIFQPLCEATDGSEASHTLLPLKLHADRGAADDIVEIATLSIGHQWFGLPADRIVEAIDATHIAEAPSTSDHFCGYMLYKDQPIGIYDIAGILNAAPPPTKEKRQVVVVRKDARTCFGILVEGLGDIPQIARARLQPLPAMLAGSKALAEHLVRPDDGAEHEDDLLQVLSVDRIVTYLGTPSMHNPDAAVAPTNIPEDTIQDEGEETAK